MLPARNPPPIRCPIPHRIRSASRLPKSYNRSNMQPAFSTPFPEPLPAAMPQLSEKPRHGVRSWNPAPHPGFNVCNSTAVLGLQFRSSGIVSGPVVAPNKPAPPTPQPPKDACGNPLVFQNGGYEPTSCPFNPNEPPATPKQRVCQFVAGVSVPLAFVGVPEVASYLEIGPAAARFLAWTGVGGTLIGLPCS